MDHDGTNDDALLIATAQGDRAAFEVFYRRWLATVTGFHLRRVGSREAAFDLTAETFAAVVLACGTFDPARGSAPAWLFSIAEHKLRDSLRRGRVEARARRELGHQPLVLDDEDLLRVEELASLGRGAALDRLLGELPVEQQAAVRARVLDERSYAAIAADLPLLAGSGAPACPPRPATTSRTTGGDGMSAFEDLQRQLLESVGSRTGSRSASGRERPSRRRPATRARRGLALIAISFVFAAAAAAAIVTRSGESPARALENRVLTLTDTGSATKGPCRIVGGRHRATLSDEAPDAGITATLPRLATAPPDPPSPRAVALAENDSGGAVLARTIREVHLPQGIALIVYVTHGQGPFTLLDPLRCLDERLATLDRLRPAADDPLRREVARRLKDLPDTTPGVQSLSLHYSQGGVDGGGTSFPLLRENGGCRQASSSRAPAATGEGTARRFTTAASWDRRPPT